MKKAKLCFVAGIFLLSACDEDVGTKISKSKLVGDGILAQEQAVQGKTIIMQPRVEDLTNDSFNIRYIELSFGNGVPENVRDLAIKQCKSMNKTAVYKSSSRGMIQFNTVKAYYECISL